MHPFPPFRGLSRRPRWDLVLFVSMLGALAQLYPAAPALAQNALVSHAEQPPRLIRKTTVYQAPAGVRLQAGDIVESTAGTVQIEWSNGARFALGPASSVLVLDAGAAPAASLLRGWGKFAGGAPPGGRLALDAGLLSLPATGASGIMRLVSEGTELFVESGAVAVNDNGPGGARAVAVGREQYAARLSTRPLAVAPRAPRLFVQQLPRAFLDPLVGVAARARAAEPKAQREIAAFDIAAWRDANPPLRRRLVAQFAARLEDAVFRNEVEDLLADQPEWRDALRRQRAVKTRANTPLNHLF
ncbi:hypothetical protein SOM61_07395 [Massilia sp. CFBP9012]|uniref:hypothetical protein n=1 Tax=Massilia sp. CFBP9012 TaxID=3096531 RepID=UPI002A6A7BD8|nr:hypothetical protein [Massilia sp. CFBP9012]MDY0974783.1 hypothetical protein [Massilia sp. CFBP9012]